MISNKKLLSFFFFIPLDNNSKSFSWQIEYMKIDPRWICANSIEPLVVISAEKIHFIVGWRSWDPLQKKRTNFIWLQFSTWTPHSIHRIYWDLVLDIGRPFCTRNNKRFRILLFVLFSPKKKKKICLKLFPFVNSKFYHANNRFNQLGHVKYMYFAHFCLLVCRSTSIFLKWRLRYINFSYNFFAQ